MFYINSISLFIILFNVLVLEMGRRGLWHNTGTGFSPWYPVFFLIIEIFFLISKIATFKDENVVFRLVDICIISFMVYYNVRAIESILYIG